MMSAKTLEKVFERIRPMLECKAGEDAVDIMCNTRSGRSLERDAITGYPLAANVVKDLVANNPSASCDHIKFLFEQEQKKTQYCAKFRAIRQFSLQTWLNIFSDLDLSHRNFTRVFRQLPGDAERGVAFARRVLRNTRAPGSLKKAALRTMYGDEFRVRTVPVNPSGWGPGAKVAVCAMLMADS